MGRVLEARRSKNTPCRSQLAEDVSVEEFTEALGEARRKRADEKALETARWELEKREYKREMERLDYEFEQLELAKKTRELEALCRAATGVEGVTGKACQGKEKVGAGDREMIENQRLSPDTTVTVLRKPDPNSVWRDGESDVEAATELVFQEKKKTEAGDTEVTGNQRVSSDATDAVPRKTVAVLRKPDPNSEWRDGESDVEAATELVCQEKKKQKLWTPSGNFPDDEGDAKMETTPCKSSQPESGAKKEKGPAQESEPATRDKAVIDILFNKRDQSCLVRLRHPESDPLLESGCNKKLDERASSGQLLSRLEEREPKVTHHEEPSTDGGCESTTSAEDKDETELDRDQVPGLGHLKKSRKRLHRIRVLRSDNDACGKKRYLKLEKCTHKKLSSRRGDAERKDIHRQESSAYNISTGKRAAGDTTESRPDEAGSKQKQPDKRRNSSKRSSKVKKRSQRSSDSTRAFSTLKEEDNSWDAGALGGKSSISSRYTGRQGHLFNVPPVIMSDLKIKSGLPDCDFKPRFKSSEKYLKSFSGTKNKWGVG
ncbi:hypothetical protein HPB47_025908 [Ixodes persulcatus]|uniref:Uncharacterized protein n=1 Tax=Ixodes persulcatus TaxID=34615 RepID=A0AC60Q072_IXOPE|nr:hypothetical protein HPB47_025908 [Ixodes persulcatus]